MATINGKKIDVLTPKQRDFVNNYTDRNNKKTYGNALQSYKESHPNANDNTAGTNGHLALKNEKIQNEISRLLEAGNAGKKVRVKILGDIMHGRITRKVRRQGTMAGKDVDYTEYQEPSATERINAVKEAAKLAGDYQKVKDDSEKDLAVHKALFKRFAKDLQAQDKKPPAKNVTDT
jgi:hypothetical protein